MNEITTMNNIQNKIYEVRGVQVMLDSDLAELFQYETKNLNRQVQRNINRFPKTYCFQLNEEEYYFLRCQNGTLKVGGRGQHKKYLPYVFTEHGVTMLSGILKSDIAVEMSIKIVNSFIAMRRYISSNLIEQKYINNMVLKNNERLTLVEDTLNKMNENKKVNSIFYKGQIFDAYYVLKEICESAKKEIIIIDNYAGKELFKLLKDINKNIIVITSNINEIDYKKYKEQYSNITIKKSDDYHDRFIIIDKSIVYHSGSSFKDLGKKCFAINKIEDKTLIHDIIKEVGEAI